MRNLAERVPADVRAELAGAAAILEEYGPMVIGALRTLQRASMDVLWAAEAQVASLDPVELTEPTEDEMDALERALGMDRGWAVAFRIEDAVHA